MSDSTIYKLKGLGLAVLIVLVLITLARIIALPGDQREAEQFNPNLWLWWLIAGTTQCVLLTALITYWILIIRGKGKPISIRLKGLGFAILIILVLITLAWIIALPSDQKGTGNFNPNLWLWWLIVGTTHCVIVLTLPVYWIIVIRGRGKPTSINLRMLTATAIFWALLIGHQTRIGYLRNKHMRIPESHYPTSTSQDHSN